MTIVETMAERKTAMLEQDELFIALPGGLGILEEISEAIAAARVGKLDKPCVFFNLNGYYDAMKAMLDTIGCSWFFRGWNGCKISLYGWFFWNWGLCSVLYPTSIETL